MSALNGSSYYKWVERRPDILICDQLLSVYQEKRESSDPEVQKIAKDAFQRLRNYKQGRDCKKNVGQKTFDSLITTLQATVKLLEQGTPDLHSLISKFHSMAGEKVRERTHRSPDLSICRQVLKFYVQLNEKNAVLGKAEIIFIVKYLKERESGFEITQWELEKLIEKLDNSLKSWNAQIGHPEEKLQVMIYVEELRKIVPQVKRPY